MKLIMDNKEPLRMHHQFESLKYEIEVEPLELGDYYFKCDKGEILIERKEMNDFDGSMVNGHLFDQAERMVEWLNNGENRLAYIITIGDTNLHNEFASVNSTSRVGAMNSIQMRYGIPVNNYTTETDFIWACHKLFRSLNEGKRGQYRTTDLFNYQNPDKLDRNDPRTFFINIFRLIPGVNITKATNIVDTLVLESVNDLILINYEDLIAIDGIGPQTAHKILDKLGIIEEDE